MIALLQDHTIQTVAMGAAILGLVSGVLGAFAVLRRQSLMGDALSHAALPGLCLGFIVAGARDPAALMGGALVTGVLAALAVLGISRTTRIKPDAALGVVLSVSFAAGLVMLSHLQGRAGQAGLSGFLFGQAAAMLRGDVVLMAWVGAGVLGLVALCWSGLKLITFDAPFAQVAGAPVRVLDIGLTALIAVAVVLGLQLVGVVLMTAMLIAPAVAARQWARRLESMVLLSGLFGLLAGVSGAVWSATARGLSTGPLIVLIATAIAVVSILLAPGRGVLARALTARRARGRLQGAQVLGILRGLADSHDNPAYPAEAAMIGSALKARPHEALMQGLARDGLIRAVPHPPDPTPRWELTEAGHARVEGGRDE